MQPLRFMPQQPTAATPLERLLRKELRGDVLFDAASRGRYSTDASIYQIMPTGIVVPRDQADVLARASVVRLWGKRSSSTIANGFAMSSISMPLRER
jgi:hypothetical protein